MKSTRRIIVRILAIAVIIGIAAWMFRIGRGHTIYFDNKKLESGGAVYEAPYQVQVLVNGESAGKLKEGERGMASVMGQKYDMELVITMQKDGKKAKGSVTMKVPYDLDGVVINLPALIGGAEEDVYMEEFIPAVVEEESDADVVVTDEFEMPMDE